MNEWTVVGVLVVLAGLFATLIKPIVGLSRNIEKLNVSVDSLNKELVDYRTANAKEHDELWDKIDEVDKQGNDHEKRLFAIEHQK